MVGFNERRGDKILNTVTVIDRGRVLGMYSKAFPCMGYFTPGRDFPVFRKARAGLRHRNLRGRRIYRAVRTLALKGAQLIFSPHFNFVNDPLDHYQTVRSDHTARAIENGVYFVRGNNGRRTASARTCRGGTRLW